MQNRKTWKSVGALLLTIAMLAGMLSVMGALPATAKTTTAMKFTADFSELSQIVTDNGGTFTDGKYRAPFTPASDTASLDGKFNTWANEKFYAYQTHGGGVRAYFGQDSNNLQTGEDTWSGNQYLAAGEDGYMKFYQERVGGQMLRKGITLSPLYNGEPAKLKDFEASLTFQFTTHAGNAGNAVVFNFHETQAGYMATDTDYKAVTTGNTVVFGNGIGSYPQQHKGWEGLAFYKAGDTISSTSVADEGTAGSKPENEIAIGDNGVRFAEALELNKDYTLTVKALNGTATVTVTDTAAGTVVYTVTKTYATAEGYVSFGFFNAPFNVKSLEVAELDSKGNQVDFGTYAASLTDGIERFTASFDNMKDVIYKDGKYYYSANHDADQFADDNTKAMATGSSTYQIDMNDSALVDYLESKFAFYYQQEGNFLRRQNVNGLYVDADGNPVTEKGSVSSSTAIYSPDTNEKKSYPQYVDYIGSVAAGTKREHFWGLSGNKFLGTSNTVAGDGMFRHADMMTVKNADGTLAQLKNFELELDFIMRPDSTYDYSNLVVEFHSPSPLVKRGDLDLGLFALSPYGGYTVGGGSSELSLTSGYIFNKTNKNYDAWSSETAATFTHQQVKNDATNTRAGIYTKTTGVNLGTSEYHLKMRVVGKNVTVTVTDTAGNEKFTINETTEYAGTGYLSIGGSNNAARFANIVVTRLDEKGNAVDFSDVNEGYTYGANFGDLAEYRFGAYYVDNGAEVFNLEKGGNPYAFADGTVADYLNEKFDFYANKEGKNAQLANPYTNTKDADIGDATDGQHHGQWKLEAGRYLAATFTEGTQGNGEMFRKSMTLVPKVNGTAVKTSNFETEFDVKFNLNKASINGSEVGAMLSFRSDEAGSVAEGWFNVANNKDAILLHPTGIAIYDVVAVDYAYKYVTSKPAGSIKQSEGYCDEFTAWEGGDAWSMHVYAKLVGKTLTVKVTETGTERVLFEGTKTISRFVDGYLYYTVAGAEVGFADIRLNLLDRDGEVRTAEEATMEGSATMSATAEELRGTAGWSTTYTNKFPNNSASIDDAAMKKYGVFDSYSAYVNARYDLYYQNQATLVKHASVVGNDAGDKGWYSHANYWGFMQFKSGGITLNKDTETEIDNTMALVPKTADGAQMKGTDCIADMTFRFDNHDGAALFGFRMAEAGRFTDKNWDPDKNASFLKVTLSGVTLYDKGVETQLETYSITAVSDLQLQLHVEVNGDKLTGYVYNAKTKTTVCDFSTTVTNTAAGYFAQGFGDTSLHLIPMTISVSGMPIAKAEATEGGKLTVERTASDRNGYFAWKVTVNKDEGEQLKPNTLLGKDAADNSTLYPTRVGFQTDDYSADSFIFYSKGDATFTADFYTPHTAADVSIPCLGTSVNETKAGLRFINRINLYTGADGKVYTDIDGVPTEVADYGVMVATKAVLGDQELTYELAQGTNRIVKRSVLAANKYFDYTTDYVDVAVQITGLDQNGDLEICSRVYLKLADNTILYSDMATRTYNQAKA